MATVTDFRNFEAFKACRTFAREIGLLVRTRKFVPNRRLADQMERASISALSNFAEGFEREGNSEFIQFLAISKGSIGELRAQLIYALDLGLLFRISLWCPRWSGGIGHPSSRWVDALSKRIS